MTTLNAQLNTLLHTDHPTTQWEKLAALMQNASESTTIWGTKVISVPDYSGTVSISDLAAKINSAADRYFIASANMTREERLNGINMMRNVNRLYYKADLYLEESFFFVQLLGIIQEVFFSLFRGSYDENKDNAQGLFRTYQFRDFDTVFPGVRSNNGISPEWIDHVSQHDNLWIVSDEMLQNFKAPKAQS